MKKTVTRPMQAMSKTAVNDVQRELQAMAVALALHGNQLVAMSQRLLAVWQAMQRSQVR